jgi:hypothetical protein
VRIQLPAASAGAIASFAWLVTGVFISHEHVEYIGPIHAPEATVDLPFGAVVLLVNHMRDELGREWVDLEIRTVTATPDTHAQLTRDRYRPFLPTDQRDWMRAAAMALASALVSGTAHG